MNKAIIIHILFWGIALFIIYAGISILLDVDDSIQRGLILPEYSNPLIRYGFSVTSLLGGLGMILLPIIAVKTKIALGIEYYEGDKKAKAKSNFVMMSTFLPAMLSFLSTYYYSNMSFLNIKFLLVAGFFSYIYLNSIFILFSSKEE